MSLVQFFLLVKITSVRLFSLPFQLLVLLKEHQGCLNFFAYYPEIRLEGFKRHSDTFQHPKTDHILASNFSTH